MKKILTIVAIALIGSLAFMGCKKSDSSPSYSMNATVNSSSFRANTCIAASSSGILSISAWNGSGTTATAPYILFTIPSWSGSTGTITLDGASGAGAYYPSSTSASVSQSGSLVITAVSSSSISGTFSFTCTDGTTVTSGSFTAKLN